MYLIFTIERLTIDPPLHVVSVHPSCAQSYATWRVDSGTKPLKQEKKKKKTSKGLNSEAVTIDSKMVSKWFILFVTLTIASSAHQNPFFFLLITNSQTERYIRRIYSARIIKK